VLRARGNLPAAEAAFRQAIRLDPENAIAHAGLGHVLSDRKDLPGAEPALRQALRLDPRSAFAHNGLGSVLYHRGDLPGAEAEYREAIRLDPTLVSAHSNLGSVLYGRGDQRGAEAAYRDAIRLDPSFANAHTNLGVVLRDRGDLAGAVASFKVALRLDPGLVALRAALPGIERMRDVQPRLPAVLAGQERPKTPAEACDFAQLCSRPFQKRFAAATRLYEGAFADDPKLAGSLSTTQTHRYSAACFAARAARGDGIDSPTGADDRAALRGKALGWMRADVALRRRQAASSDPAERAAAAARLGHWLADSDFSGVRDPRALEALPGEERKLWREFWSTVSAALAEARKPPPPPMRLPPPEAEGP
jgi:Flp pilus assembly protein TadD